ncbi:hypothetical protein V1511DRAFT_225889 [Dipodascopsis uninucleata]
MDSEAILPIIFDEVTKRVSLPDEELTPKKAEEIQALNLMYRDLISLNADVPPPPNQINGRLNDQVKKLKDTGNVSFKKGQYSDAIRMYTLAIEMGLKRPLWEASGYVREELSVLYSNRAQAYMSQSAWAEALMDAEASVFLKKNVPKAHYRKGKCLQYMGRLREAKDAFQIGIESCENDLNDLKTALSEVCDLIIDD